MKTIFKSHNLWGFVENGYKLPSNEKEMDEKQLIAAQDLIAVSDEIFPTITNQESAKDAWDVLKQEFKDDA